MSLDALVTRLEITPRGELYVGIRNLNGIFFPWKNLFVTKILGRSSSDHESFLEASFNFERLRDQIRKIKSTEELNHVLDERASELVRQCDWDYLSKIEFYLRLSNVGYMAPNIIVIAKKD